MAGLGKIPIIKPFAIKKAFFRKANYTKSYLK
jgi:hypothetical protein